MYRLSPIWRIEILIVAVEVNDFVIEQNSPTPRVRLKFVEL